MHIDFRISDRNKNTGGKIEAALLTLVQHGHNILSCTFQVRGLRGNACEMHLRLLLFFFYFSNSLNIRDITSFSCPPILPEVPYLLYYESISYVVFINFILCSNYSIIRIFSNFTFQMLRSFILSVDYFLYCLTTYSKQQFVQLMYQKSLLYY